MSFEADLDAILREGKEKTALDMLKAIMSSYGEIPYVFSFMKDNPEILISKVLYNNAIKESSALDERTIELISIAVSAAIRCSHCMRLHIRIASKLGVPDDQIAAAVFMAGNLCAASVLSSAASHLDEESEICPICELANKSSELQGEVKN
jgi:AhpD family alkylhydroperoxidase